MVSKAVWQLAQTESEAERYQPRWPKTTTQGVRVRLTAARSLVSQAVVVGEPEVAQAAGRAAGHAPVVDVAGEVGLAGEADGLGVLDAAGLVRGPAVVAVSVVVAGADHVRLGRGDPGDLVKEGVEDVLVDHGALLGRGWSACSPGSPP